MADDLRAGIAEIRGMLSATLPQHAAQLVELSRTCSQLAQSVAEQGNQIAALTAVSADRATERRTTPQWVSVAALLVSVAAVLITGIALIVQ